MAQLMPLPLTVFCFSKIQIGFTFLVPAHPGSHRQRAIKRVRVFVTGGADLQVLLCSGHKMVGQCSTVVFVSFVEYLMVLVFASPERELNEFDG